MGSSDDGLVILGASVQSFEQAVNQNRLTCLEHFSRMSTERCSASQIINGKWIEVVIGWSEKN